MNVNIDTSMRNPSHLHTDTISVPEALKVVGDLLSTRQCFDTPETYVGASSAVGYLEHQGYSTPLQT